MQDESTPFCIETGLEMYNLHHFEVLWEKQPSDTKCILAWVSPVSGHSGTALLFFSQHCDIFLRLSMDMHKQGCRCHMVLLLQGDGIIVVGFRGTASLANVLADLKVRWKGFL